MSLRLRITLTLFGAIALALVLAWWVSARAILGPVFRDLAVAWEQQVAFVAREVEAGRPPEELARRLGLDVRLRPHPPRRARRCHPARVDGRDLLLCRGPRGLGAARLERGGWVLVRRPFDSERLGERMGAALLVVGALLGFFAWWLAGRLVRPLKVTLGAMERMAAGDLRHRIATSGARELRDSQEAFNRMADRIESMLEAERSLMAGMSHELRTPLARLRLEIELLRDRLSGLESEPRLDAMENDLAETERLIDELFTLSRLSFGERPSNRTPVDLGALAEEVLTQVEPQLEWSIEGVPATVEGDRAQLARLLRNLIQNAEKYAPPGSRAHIVHHPDGFEVVDEGPGVEPGELSKLFEPFFRGRRQQRATGWGLGLMIARQIAEMHGGAVQARNVEPRGLAIRLVLPGRAPTRSP